MNIFIDLNVLYGKNLKEEHINLYHIIYQNGLTKTYLIFESYKPYVWYLYLAHLVTLKWNDGLGRKELGPIEWKAQQVLGQITNHMCGIYTLHI